MCSDASEGGRTGSPRVSHAGCTRGGEARDDVGRAGVTHAFSPKTPRCEAESASGRATRDAALLLQAEVVRAWQAWETTPGTRGRWKMTLPELYLAYIAHTGEELRDALLRVANEPRSNPNRRNVHELLAEHLGDVAAVTAGAGGRVGEQIFHVCFFREDPALFGVDGSAPRPTPGLRLSSERPREGEPRTTESASCVISVPPTEKPLWSPEPKRPRARTALVAETKRRLSLAALAADAATLDGRRRA